MVHVAAKPTSTASSHPIKLAKLKLRRRPGIDESSG
jgi:hypothetical protein